MKVFNTKMLFFVQDLLSYSLEGLQDLWKDVMSHSEERRGWITELDENLKKAEDDRMQMVSCSIKIMFYFSFLYLIKKGPIAILSVPLLVKVFFYILILCAESDIFGIITRRVSVFCD